MDYSKYKLSKEFNEKKNEHEKIIEQKIKECSNINNEISKLKKDEKNLDNKKEYDILNLEIKKSELERDIYGLNGTIKQLYIREMRSNLDKARLNKEIDPTQYSDQKRRLDVLRTFVGCKNDLEGLKLDDNIINFKIKLEELKNQTKLTTIEQKNTNIKEFQREKEITKECYESSKEDLINKKYDYDYKNIYYDRKIEKIGREEQQEKIRELENKEKVEPTDEEVEKMFDDFSDKYLEKEEISNEEKNANDVNKSKYEKEISKRNNETYKRILYKK